MQKAMLIAALALILGFAYLIVSIIGRGSVYEGLDERGLLITESILHGLWMMAMAAGLFYFFNKK